jgi:hypothetical protein
VARKLTSGEELAFVKALQNVGGPLSEAEGDWFLQTLSNQRDTAPSLTSELGEWFDEDMSAGLGS